MYFYALNKKKVAVSIIIAIIAVVGDKNSEGHTNDLAAALCDNLSHGLIGAFIWIGMFVFKTSKADIYFLTEILLCGLCSSAIDVDHFIAAKSVNLKDATSLKHRPFMHCTSITMLVVFFLITVSNFFGIHWLYKFGWILAASFISHHIRDSKRRGFWLWPFGSTMATPNAIYVIALMFLPHFLSVIFNHVSPPEMLKSEPSPSVQIV